MNRGAALLDQVIEHGDENGDVANSTADDLRDALVVAADRLRALSGQRPRGPMLIGSRRLVAEVWQLVRDHKLNARSMAADAALDLRDTIDTRWEPEVADERACLPGWGGR